MAGHGGAWKVAYADFVTAMMAFFMVMWIVAQNKPAVKEAIAGYFNDPLGTSTTPGKSRQSLKTQEISPASGAKGVKGVKGAAGKPEMKSNGEDEPEGGVARKPSLMVLHDGNHALTGAVIPFPDDSADLDDRSKEKLKQLLPELLGKPFKIELRGHTSMRPKLRNSQYKDTWELAYARSVTTMNYLTEQGVEARRFRLSQAGGFEPKSVGQGAAELKTQNSRVEVYVLAELVDDLMGSRKERDDRTKTPDHPTRPKMVKRVDPDR